MRHVTPWPYTRPVVVLSATLRAADLPPEVAAKVRVIDASPAEVMNLLDTEGVRRAYVDGGLVIQSFLRAGLIADMVITSVPILLGSGRRLFDTLPGDLPLIHERTQSFPSGLVQSAYRVSA